MSIKTLDDRDPSIQYGPPGKWGQGGVQQENDGTTSFTPYAGSTITIPFTGTQISIFGTISNKGLGDPPSSTYSIDAGTPQTFNGVPADSILYRQLFFRSAELTPSAHMLVITSTTDNAYFWFDYAEIVTPPPQISSKSQSSTTTTTSQTTSSTSTSSSTSSTTSSSTSSSSSITSSSTSHSITLPFTPSQPLSSSSITTTTSTGPLVTSDASNSSSKDLSPDGSHTNTTSNKPSTGVIVGAVVGSLALILFVLFAIWVLRKRKRTYVEPPLMVQADSEPPSSAPYHVTPFAYEPRGYVQGSIANPNAASSHYNMPPAPGSESQWSGTARTQYSHAASPSQSSDLNGSSTHLYNQAVNVHVPQTAPAASAPYPSKGQLAHSQRVSETFTNPPPVYQA
ncbi:hypothetical protein CPC08DRAFT_699169 [Agrocybe pediades]|nr:hypothetical protein CPC08DRAFT_699169 [Agrocybe pediades]